MKKNKKKIIRIKNNILSEIEFIIQYRLLKKKIYVRQNINYGIGNFINCTPAIQALANKLNERILVYFENQDIQKLFNKAPFMEITDENKIRGRYCALDSSLINYNIPDYEYIFKIMKRRFRINTDDIPHTYVDSLDNSNLEIKNGYAVILRGARNDEWLPLKDPGDEIYKYIIDKVNEKFDIIFLGSKDDYFRNIKRMKNWAENFEIYLDDISKSLAIINYAKIVITNDTGFYHVACALKKKVFVLWKDTKFPKNKAPGDNCKYSFKENWYDDFDKWYDEFSRVIK